MHFISISIIFSSTKVTSQSANVPKECSGSSNKVRSQELLKMIALTAAYKRSMLGCVYGSSQKSG